MLYHDVDYFQFEYNILLAHLTAYSYVVLATFSGDEDQATYLSIPSLEIRMVDFERDLTMDQALPPDLEC